MAAAPAGAATSGKMYACYSDKTKALYYATSSKCKTGFTSISWNQQGPQGAKGPQGAQGAQGSQGSGGPQGAQGAQGSQGSRGSQGAQGAQGSQGNPGSQGSQGPQGLQGAQGTQGPAGAVAGYSARRYNTLLTKETPTVVASLTPAVGAYYAVNGTTLVTESGSGQTATCRDGAVNASGVLIGSTTTSGVDPVPQGQEVTVPTTGILNLGIESKKTIVEVCSTTAHAAYAYQAALTAVQLSTANGADSASHLKLKNRIVTPRKLRPPNGRLSRRHR